MKRLGSSRVPRWTSISSSQRPFGRLRVLGVLMDAGGAEVAVLPVAGLAGHAHRAFGKDRRGVEHRAVVLAAVEAQFSGRVGAQRHAPGLALRLDPHRAAWASAGYLVHPIVLLAQRERKLDPVSSPG